MAEMQSFIFFALALPPRRLKNHCAQTTSILLMRFNIPSLPQTDRLYQTCTNLTEAVEKVVGLLHRHPRTLIVTGTSFLF